MYNKRHMIKEIMMITHLPFKNDLIMENSSVIKPTKVNAFSDKLVKINQKLGFERNSGNLNIYFMLVIFELRREHKMVGPNLRTLNIELPVYFNQHFLLFMETK